MNEPKIRKCLECNGSGMALPFGGSGIECKPCQGTGKAPPKSDAKEYPDKNEQDRIYKFNQELKHCSCVRPMAGIAGDKKCLECGKPIKPQSDAGAEFPPEKDDFARPIGKAQSWRVIGYNEARSDCLAVHERLMSEKEAEIYKIKDNLVRMITGECSKNHKPTFEEISELGCAICNKAEIARLREALEKIEYALAQPLDRISNITLEDYGVKRQEILDIATVALKKEE